MEQKMIQISLEELLLSLEAGYKEVKVLLENGADEVDLAHIKGYCTTIEQMLATYGGVSVDEMMKIKMPIIGDISLRRKSDKTSLTSKLEEPTYLRLKKKNSPL